MGLVGRLKMKLLCEGKQSKANKEKEKEDYTETQAWQYKYIKPELGWNKNEEEDWFFSYQATIFGHCIVVL